MAASTKKPLVVIPTYLTEDSDADVTMEAVQSVRKTQGEAVEMLLVDDGSPNRRAVGSLKDRCADFDADFHMKKENTGFSKTVNVGLKLALNEGRDAVLMNADVECDTPGWIRHFKGTQDKEGRKAACVGALLLFPNGLIQHAGIFFSLLTRTFDHRFKYGPGNLPDALKPTVCPVTGAFQYIRHSTLEEVGLYDENFLLGWEDVDYCVRVFEAGMQCIYNPNVRAWHHEMLFRGRPSAKVQEWQQKSFMYLMMKWRERSFGEWVPFQ